MMAEVTHCALVGVTGAFSVSVIDGALTRLPWLNGRVWGRALSRLAIAGTVAYVAHKLRAPAFVPEGIVVGAVLIASIDIVIAAMPLARINPPQAASIDTLGLPWGPQPLYAIPRIISPTDAQAPVGP